MRLTFGVQHLSQEIVELAKRHWAEMPFDLDVPLAPSWETYSELDDAGRLHITTARAEGVLVGYFIFFIGRHPHYDVLAGSMDVYYLAPEFRKGTAGIRLFMETERFLRSRGVQYLLATSRLDRDKSASALFERLGWKAARVVYEKRLGVE